MHPFLPHRGGRSDRVRACMVTHPSFASGHRAGVKLRALESRLCEDEEGHSRQGRKSNGVREKAFKEGTSFSAWSHSLSARLGRKKVKPSKRNHFLQGQKSEERTSNKHIHRQAT